VVDLSDPNSGAAALEATLAKFGRADILLHVVGGWTGGKTIVDFEVDAFAEMLQQHFWTTLHVLRAFAPHFVGNGWGRVVVVSSPLVAAPAAKNAPYIVAKSAQEALILSLAQEVKHTGVTANVVRVKAIDVKRQKLSEPSPANASWTTPEEISETILYLCSDQACRSTAAPDPELWSPLTPRINRTVRTQRSRPGWCPSLCSTGGRTGAPWAPAHPG
jgi:NAD(P)-dependent dehydrogenase (short-subunit alcohol dehydrogenase family)